MTEQPMLPDFPEAMARAEQRDIDKEAAQMHLAREFIRWGKYAKYSKFSKDPEFQKRCYKARLNIATMMGRAGR